MKPLFLDDWKIVRIKITINYNEIQQNEPQSEIHHEIYQQFEKKETSLNLKLT